MNFELFRSVENLLKACETLHVSIWPTDDSLLGVVRYGLPFLENKATFAIFSHSYEKLKTNDTIKQYYNNNNNNHILSTCGRISIGLYNENHDKNDEITPLIFTHVIGHRIALPSRYTKRLVEKYGNINLSPPVRSLPSIHLQTIDDWIRYSNWCEEPFFIPHFPFFHATRESFEEVINRETQQIRGYGGPAKENQDIALIEGADEGHEYCGVALYYMHDGKTCWNQFNDQRLQVNIHDQEVSTEIQQQLLPSKWIEQSKQILGEEWNFYSLTWVLTNAPKVSGFHTDPDMCRGAWMHLIEGEKIWWFIHPNDWEYLQEKGYRVEDVARLDMWELLQIENSYLYGKVFTGRLTAGGAMFFPSKCLHKVITTQNSIGFGGYW